MAKTAGLSVIPPNMKVVTLPDGKSALQKKTRSRRRYKMPLAQRKKISAAAKKIKIPVLTVGANMFPAVGTATWVFDKETGLMANVKPLRKIESLWNNSLKYYTGLSVQTDGVKNVTGIKFNFMDMALGTGTNLLAWGARKSGIFKSTNQKLGKARLPISLS